MSALAAFVRLGRPLFLGGGVLMFALGATIARATGHSIDVTRFALGQGAVTAFQLMTHYANDYFDLEVDRANVTPTRWSGGSRVLVDGTLPPVVALTTALALAAVGVGLSLVLALSTRDRVVAGTLAAMAVLAWIYSAPPRLCARGLGELDTAIVVTGLVPWLGYYLFAPDLRGVAWLVLSLVPPGLLQFAMLLAIEFPDATGDAAAGKRTLVVRLGTAHAARVYAALVAGAFAWFPVAFLGGLPGRVAIAGALVAPVAAWRIARIRDHSDPSAHARLTFFAVLLLVATAAAELVGWIAER